LRASCPRLRIELRFTDEAFANRFMDLEKTIAELRQQSQLISEAIEALERLAEGGKRRGRPPRWLQSVRRLREAEDESVEVHRAFDSL